MRNPIMQPQQPTSKIEVWSQWISLYAHSAARSAGRYNVFLYRKLYGARRFRYCPGNPVRRISLRVDRDDRDAPLSVLSALARLDVDPWHTAAALAQLPKATAAQRLAFLFAELPDGPAYRDAIAERLV